MHTDEEKRAYLTEFIKRRGYAHRSHRLLVNHDLDLLRSMNAPPTATYVRDRTLTLAEKELILVPAFACLRAPAYIIRVHVDKAVKNGMPLRALLEAVEILAIEAGRTIFADAMQVLAEAAGDDVIEDKTDGKPTMTDDAGFKPLYERFLAKNDPAACEAIRSLDEVISRKRLLTPKLKAMITVVILTILKAPAEGIKEHIKRALAAGATEQEVLEAIELIVTPAGLPTFEHGLVAWADATGAKPFDL